MFFNQHLTIFNEHFEACWQDLFFSFHIDMSNVESKGIDCWFIPLVKETKIQNYRQFKISMFEFKFLYFAIFKGHSLMVTKRTRTIFGVAELHYMLYVYCIPGIYLGTSTSAMPKLQAPCTQLLDCSTTRYLPQQTTTSSKAVASFGPVKSCPSLPI